MPQSILLIGMNIRPFASSAARAGNDVTSIGVLNVTDMPSGVRQMSLMNDLGGIFPPDPGHLDSSMIADSSNANCEDNGTGTVIITGSYSLDDDGTCVTDGVSGNIVADPQVGPLQNNGGNTLTHSLTAWSPALDQIPPGTNGCGTTYTTDQTGEVRPIGDACDIG